LYYLIGQLMTVIPMFWLGYAAMPRRVLDYPAVLGGWHAVVSAGHMLSIAGMMAFFIMIFDSMRQARAATRNSFGVARFNTRLNFYIYEGARTWFIQRKGWVITRFNFVNSTQLNKLNFANHEYLETTLYSYAITGDKN
jgi:heme/copper-type cytochrome/quinol oxidase subunit 1